MVAVWLVISYLSGALPWAVWLGRRFYGVDPRQQGDGNPGALNAYRAGGRRLGTATLILDFLKAFVPVFVARWGFDFAPHELLWIALMPSLGHAFSVFLRFRGGRGLVTWFGVWTALTLYEAPLVMGAAAIAGTRLLKSGEARALAIPAVLIPYLLLRGSPSWMVWLVVAQTLILGLKISALYLSPQRRGVASRP
ncbi:MAG: glycerol-3-phosphate acyltransferase [Anaerolineae bacterium]|nr:glycerol-3-phosphate acyltransferase [Anaerolineae bacterium]